MLQYSKVIKSREEWKNKAIKRADENRQHRKAKTRDLEIIAELKAKNILLEHELDEQEKKLSKQK
ncbi:hypothetical protein [Crocosphaera sp.]|uniref:hypothetical protein n=1 Tax=Crocosphaera sp. TaxID=2729996 RepID=UPI00257EC94A|nr:hypothetical protein [Crocosphaera sp.]NQZ65072.1 hypothetical protein [Crocosphaera sp.]